ncbi:MAG: 23S rRNA (adenine(2503)-C(2))-methyltransferase RlmN, partial [Ruminococcaceae bacterium]|nr:23S rRNA (adenine(2503)-C(2))-methyltransferase RlmN [Oscillospiraceae bacterium]
MERPDIRALTPEQLKEVVLSLGVPAFRAKQVRDWLDKGVSSFDQMSNLPISLREQLEERFSIPSVKILRKLVSASDGT